MKIGFHLRQARLATGLSQEKLAYKMRPPMSREYLNRIENNRHSPTLATLETICKALGIPTWQLIKAAEESAPKRRRG